MLIRCLLLSVWRKSGPAQFFHSPSTKYNWCWKIWGGEKTDQVEKKMTGYFFLPGKKMTSQFLPRGRNGPAWSFPRERLAGGKNWLLHRYLTNLIQRRYGSMSLCNPLWICHCKGVFFTKLCNTARISKQEVSWDIKHLPNICFHCNKQYKKAKKTDPKYHYTICGNLAYLDKI